MWENDEDNIPCLLSPAELLTALRLEGQLLFSITALNWKQLKLHRAMFAVFFSCWWWSMKKAQLIFRSYQTRTGLAITKHACFTRTHWKNGNHCMWEQKLPAEMSDPALQETVSVVLTNFFPQILISRYRFSTILSAILLFKKLHSWSVLVFFLLT